MAFDPQAPIDAVFATFGVDLTVDPDGATPATLRVVPDGESASEFVHGRAVVAGRLEMRVRAADLSQLAEGTEVEILGARRIVRGASSWEDPRRLVALVPTVSA